MQLLGRFQLTTGDGLVVPVSAARQQGLLAWLALNPGPQPRSSVAEALWPDHPGAGRNNLRQVLHQVRRAWPEHGGHLGSDDVAIWWCQPLGVDVLEFEDHYDRATRAWHAGDRVTAAEHLAEAVARYAGPLLPGCDELWIAERRDQLQRRAVHALDRLARWHEDQHELAPAIDCATRAVAIDPLREAGALLLMRLHALNGDIPAARRVFEATRRKLADELGVAPSSELAHAAAGIVRSRRADRGAPQHAAPLIGREGPWRALVQAWRRCEREGRTAMAVILGEAGVGKSRLAEELARWADAQGISTASARGYAAGAGLVLSPVAGWLRSPMISPSLQRIPEPLRRECSRLLPELIGDTSNTEPPEPLLDDLQRQRFFAALVQMLRTAATSMVLVLDDLQWCDVDTLAWLQYLLSRPSTGPLLVVGTARDDEVTGEHPLADLMTQLRAAGGLVEIELGPLGEDDAVALATVVADRDLTPGQARELFGATWGNPLFVIETVRAGLVTEAAQPAASSLPPRVHAVIAGRLAGLSPGTRELAGLAAVIGRAFDIDELTAAGDLGLAEVAGGIDELWSRRLVRETGAPAGSGEFDFAHDRIRDVAYGGLTPAQRRLWHLRMADHLETLVAQGHDAFAAEISRHYDAAGHPRRALPWYERAAGAAQGLFAYEQSRRLLERSIALLPHEPDVDLRAKAELRAQTMLAAAIRVTNGWASPELEPVHSRVAELAHRVGTREQRAIALLQLAFFGEVRAEFATVGADLAAMQAAADLADSPPLRIMAATATLGHQMMTSRFAAAEATYRETAGWYRPEHHAVHVALTGADFGVLHRAWSSHSVAMLGDGPGAVARAEEALALARSLSHPFSESLALCYLATVHQLAGEAERCATWADAASRLAEQFNVAYYAAWARILLAWSESVSAPSPAAADRIHRRIDTFVATGAGSRVGYYLALAADAAVRAGDPLGALADLDRGLATSARQGDTWYDALAHASRAEVLAALDRPREAVIEAQLALAMARAQGATAAAGRAAGIAASLEADHAP